MDIEYIQDVIYQNYNVGIQDIELFREGGNQTYIIHDKQFDYFLKVIRPPFLKTSLQSIDVQLFLLKEKFSVIPIILTKFNEPYVCFSDSSVDYIFVLFEYIPGDEPDINDTEKVGELVGQLHQTMKKYPGCLPKKGKNFFINRYVDIMRKANYEKTDWFQSYGDELWEKVKNLAHAYCHCDLYRENINKTSNNQMFVIDFDTSCMAYPLYDIVLFCNDTDYFTFDIEGFDRTKERIAKFMAGYQKHCTFNHNELSLVYNLIAVYHFQLQATMIELYGFNDNQFDFFDNQYKWLIKWQEQCKEKLLC